MADTHSEAVSAVDKLENAVLLALSGPRPVCKRSKAAHIITKCYAPSFRAIGKERDKFTKELLAEAERSGTARGLLGELVMRGHSAGTTLTGMARIMASLGFKNDAEIMLKNADRIEALCAALKELYAANG